MNVSAESLDVLVRIAHPEWFAILCEYAYQFMTAPEEGGDIGLYISVVEKAYLTFGDNLIENFKMTGLKNPAEWWREYIAEIAARSDNDSVLEAQLAYLSPRLPWTNY